MIRAVRRLPTGDSAEIKRSAVVLWRRCFLEMMFARKPHLRINEDHYLSNLASGEAIAFEAITPTLILCQTREDYDLYDYFRMWSSFPTVDRPGRRLKFLVRDVGQPGAPLIGLCCLSSAVRQLRVRDDWIGWRGPNLLNLRASNLAYIMDLSTCISLPPYSYLTAGKLLAAMMASNEVRDIYRARYSRQLSIFRRRILEEFALLTTAGGYGRNAPQYKGLSYNGSTLFQFIGYSKGYSTFQIPPDLYREVKVYVSQHRDKTDSTMTGGANAKIRILRIAARELGIPEEDLIFSGHRRAIFAAPLAFNWREFLFGKTRSIDYYDHRMDSIIEVWKKRWLLKRVGDSAIVRQARNFYPEDLRMSKLLRIGPLGVA